MITNYMEVQVESEKFMLQLTPESLSLVRKYSDLKRELEHLKKYSDFEKFWTGSRFATKESIQKMRNKEEEISQMEQQIREYVLKCMQGGKVNDEL